MSSLLTKQLTGDHEITSMESPASPEPTGKPQQPETSRKRARPDGTDPPVDPDYAGVWITVLLEMSSTNSRRKQKYYPLLATEMIYNKAHNQALQAVKNLSKWSQYAKTVKSSKAFELYLPCKLANKVACPPA